MKRHRRSRISSEILRTKLSALKVSLCLKTRQRVCFSEIFHSLSVCELIYSVERKSKCQVLDGKISE